jgi:preprotein translocase SecE subunit
MMAQDVPNNPKNAKARRAKQKEAKTPGSPESRAPRTPRGEHGQVIAHPRRSYADQVRAYFKGVVAESKRVTWPGKTEVIAGTVTTLVILVVFSAYMGYMDYVLNALTLKLGL